jgi:hypothetical protein
MKKRATPSAVFGVIVLGALGLAACGSSPPKSSSSSTTSTTAIAPAAALATGNYAPPESSGTPHYVVTITSADSTAFNGTITFVYQDGTTSSVLDFRAKTSGKTTTATVSSVATAAAGTDTLSSSLPDPLQIEVGPGLLTFQDCKSYLPQVQSQGDCAFELSP